MNTIDTAVYMADLGRRARDASRAMARADTARKDTALSAVARLLRDKAAGLVEANRQDLAGAREAGLDPAFIDRLGLSQDTVEQMAAGLEQIVLLPDPIGEISDVRQRPSGIQVGRMRVPLGVIGIIYESRPNVTIDAAGLCIKSGNATILRGGSEAIHSNRALAALIQEGLAEAGLPADAVQMVATTDRAAVGSLITSPQWVDVIIPRGGKSLIERVASQATVPVIKHLDGVCHVFIDESADPAMAVRIADNAKTQRYAPCNTMETLLVAAAAAPRVLPELGRIYIGKSVELRGDAATRELLARHDIACLRCHRGGLAHRIPCADPVDPDRGGPRRSHRPYQRVRIQPYRRHRHRRSCQCHALPARGRLVVGPDQRLDPLCRRLRVRTRRRDRHFDQQAARARPGRTRRPDLAEVRRVRQRPDPHLMGYLWVKTAHIVFVVSWFAGLFYLPRLFVNLAMVTPQSPAERERLLLMARKLYRFMLPLAVLAVATGLWMWLGYGVGRGPGNDWLHAKLAGGAAAAWLSPRLRAAAASASNAATTAAAIPGTACSTKRRCCCWRRRWRWS